MAELRIRTCGPQALIVDCEPEYVLSIASALRSTHEYIDVVPAERSVFISSQTVINTNSVLEFARANANEFSHVHSRTIEIPVNYCGEDLDEVAQLTGMSREGVIELHTSTVFTAAFAGFAPGFLYCTGLPLELVLPRRSNPRVSVPAGSVAIADIYSAIYPQASPGGWHLLGVTEVQMFDLKREPASYIQPGDSVRYVRASL